MRVHDVGLTISLAIIGTGACWAQPAGQPRDPDHVYAVTCHYCHDTGIGPVLKGSHYPVDQIRTAVRHGHGSMPSFMPSEITEAELAALVHMLSDAALPKAGEGTRP
jgi:mono/diheme cytochrome c family protein